MTLYKFNICRDVGVHNLVLGNYTEESEHPTPKHAEHRFMQLVGEYCPVGYYYLCSWSAVDGH